MSSPDSLPPAYGQERPITDRILSPVEDLTLEQALERRIREAILAVNAMSWHLQRRLSGDPSAKDDYLRALTGFGELDLAMKHADALVKIHRIGKETRENCLQLVADAAINTHIEDNPIKSLNPSAQE